MRRLPFTQNYNLRELGGIPISLTKEITYHQFLRADALLELTDKEIKFLKDYGIKVIIDLRNDLELMKKPNVLRDNKDFIYYSIPFLNETRMEENKSQKPSQDLSERSLLDIYIEIFDDHKMQIKEFFNIILNHLEDGILFHCSAGKDRTGTLTALLLTIAGVDRLDILADYEVSYTFLLPRLRKLQSLFPNLPMHIMVSEADCLDNALNHIVREYCSIENYLLKEIGLTAEEIKKIKTKLVCEVQD